MGVKSEYFIKKDNIDKKIEAVNLAGYEFELLTSLKDIKKFEDRLLN